jgi:hypothetical protein
VQANQYSNYSPLEGQISPDTLESSPDSRLPNDQQFICPNCGELTTGFPCEHCGYEDEGLYELD